MKLMAMLPKVTVKDGFVSLTQNVDIAKKEL